MILSLQKANAIKSQELNDKLEKTHNVNREFKEIKEL